MKWLLILILPCLASCSHGAATEREDSQHEVRYVDARMINRYYVRRDQLVVDSIVSKIAGNDGHERPWFELINCSNKEYQCVWVEVVPFAVPKTKIKEKQVFTFLGARYTIEKCYRYRAETCIVALIKAECPFVSREKSCSFSDASFKEGDTAYYYYNEDYGVTAFGFASEADSADGFTIAASYTLRSEKGLLAPMR